MLLQHDDSTINIVLVLLLLLFLVSEINICCRLGEIWNLALIMQIWNLEKDYSLMRKQNKQKIISSDSNGSHFSAFQKKYLGCLSLSFFVFLATILTVTLMLQCCVCMECIVSKRCILEQNLLLTAYRKSYMGNQLVPKWMTLTFVSRSYQGHVKHCVNSTLNISETVRDRDLVPKDHQ